MFAVRWPLPFKNEHSARIKPPDSFDETRRSNDEFGKGVHAIFGVKDGTSEVQAIRFATSEFTVEQARKWLTDNDYKPIEFEEATGEETHEAMGPEETVRLVRGAWEAKFGSTETAFIDDRWPREVLGDQIIAEGPEGLFSYPFTITEGGNVEFGEPFRVKVEYIKVSEHRRTSIKPRITEADGEFSGREWEITIIGAETAADIVEVEGRKLLRSKNGRLYDLKALEASVPDWEGIKVYDNHLTDEEFEERGGMRSVAEEWIGSITQPAWDGGALPGIVSVLKVIEEKVASKLKNAWDAGVLDTIGLSIDTFTLQGQEAVEVEGQSMPVIEGFQKIVSVDLVAEPAAGGGFNRLIAAQQQHSEVTMDEKQLKKLIASLVLEAFTGDHVTGEQREALAETVYQAAVGAKAAEAEDPKTIIAPLIESLIAIAGPAPGPMAEPPPVTPPAPIPATPPPTTAPPPPTDPSVAERIDMLECSIILRDKLDAAKLRDKTRVLVESLFGNKVFEAADLDAAIKRAKEADADRDPTGRVSGAGAGAGRPSLGMSGQDVAEVEFLRLAMGRTKFRALESAEKDYVTERVPESYRRYVKAGKPSNIAPGRPIHKISEWVYHLLGGDPLLDDRAYEAITTSGMSSIVKNAVNVMLAADYARRHIWWEDIVTIEEVDTIDNATLVRVYGLSTLDVVDEGQAYTELAGADEEETAEFVKKGNFVGVTLEAMMRDKVAFIRTLPNRLATSWHNTISALVAGVFTVNSNTGPILGTGGALFNNSAVSGAGGHANLLVAGLSYTAYSAARTAVRKQTDQPLGAGQKLLIKPKFSLVPTDLETTSQPIFGSEFVPGSGNNDINPYFREAQTIVVPNWTDTDNWGLVADPMEFPAIWLIFPRGQQVPRIVTAGDESSGAMFTNDTLRYKARMLTYRFSATYDCAPVSDFRPLHKSNV